MWGAGGIMQIISTLCPSGLFTSHISPLKFNFLGFFFLPVVCFCIAFEWERQSKILSWLVPVRRTDSQKDSHDAVELVLAARLYSLLCAASWRSFCFCTDSFHMCARMSCKSHLSKWSVFFLITHVFLKSSYPSCFFSCKLTGNPSVIYAVLVYRYPLLVVVGGHLYCWNDHPVNNCEIFREGITEQHGKQLGTCVWSLRFCSVMMDSKWTAEYCLEELSLLSWGVVSPALRSCLSCLGPYIQYV